MPMRVPDQVALKGRLLSADALVVGGRSLSPRLTARVKDLAGVRAAVPISIASVPVGDSVVTFAAVEPAKFRRFAPESTANMDKIWVSLTRGDAVISHQLRRDVNSKAGGVFTIGNAPNQVRLRVGAYATTVPRIQAVVDEKRGRELGMKPRNALLLSLERHAIDETVTDISDVIGDDAQVEPLTAPHQQAAAPERFTYLTGGAVAQAVGSFRYRAFPNGTVAPDPKWIAANIRTEAVPILGRVTGHRVMLPQLRAALSEVVARGLQAAIDPRDYGGCYVPRFIGHDPDRGLSLHTWGIALDLNVATNQRGTIGQLDRRVVSIFKRWGFAWGGDWQWTDPMHFELAALVRGRS